MKGDQSIHQMSVRALVLARRTYSRLKADGTYETWPETIDRVVRHQAWLWAQACHGAFSMADELGMTRPAAVTTVTPNGTLSDVFEHPTKPQAVLVRFRVAPGPTSSSIDLRMAVRPISSLRSISSNATADL